MRGITVVLLIGLFLSLPAPALSKGPVLTDAQLEDVAAVPDDPEPSGQAGPPEPAEDSIASVAAARALQRRYRVIYVVPSLGSGGVVETVLEFRGTPAIGPIAPPTGIRNLR